MDIVLIAIIFFNTLFLSALLIAIVPILLWWDRKIARFVQSRHSISNVSLEELISNTKRILNFFPKAIEIKDKPFLYLAPLVTFAFLLLALFLVTFADNLTIDEKSYVVQTIPTNLGVLWIFACIWLSSLGNILTAINSNKQFAQLKWTKEIAQSFFCKVIMLLSAMSLIVSYDTIYSNDIITQQTKVLFEFLPFWGIFIQPIASFIFLVCVFFEFCVILKKENIGLLKINDLVKMLVLAALSIILFFGGYEIPFVSTEVIKSNINMFLIFFIAIVLFKVLAINFWIRKAYIFKEDSEKTKIFIWLFTGIGVIFVIITFALFFIQLGENTINILTAIIQMVIFFIKLILFCMFFIWLKSSFLAPKYEEIEIFSWKILAPLSLLNLFFTAIFVVLGN